VHHRHATDPEGHGNQVEKEKERGREVHGAA
jgi:hypothetical protein